MEIWNYLEILRNNKHRWFINKEDVEGKINALNKIHEIGLPNTISNLFPFLKDKNNEIRNATCNTIIHLFNKIETKKEYYEILKNCDILNTDLDLFETSFSKDQFIYLLAIASLNWNGFIREKAVKKLAISNDPRAIQFLIYRLADWVVVIKQEATSGLENFKNRVFVDTLIENLSVFEWLQKVERTNLSSFYNEIIQFLIIENKDYILKKFASYKDKTRLLLAKEISSSMILDSTSIKLLINDKHFLIRNLALIHFDKLTKSEIEMLLNDKSAKVRLQLLYKLKDQSDFSDLIIEFLADRSASIREFARHSLKLKKMNFSFFYNSNLLSNKNVIGSLSGIAETSGKQFLSTVQLFLSNDNLKIKKAAFLAVKKLDDETAYNFSLENLDSEFVGIRNVLIDFLSNNSTSDVLEKARNVFKSEQIGLKKSMLKLFSKIGGYLTIADIIIGTIDNNEDIRNLSFEYLQRWRNQAVRLFIQPKADDISRAKQILNFASEVHDEKKYFKDNPLIGLDFFLKY